jgi:hypothetical protein
MANIVTRFRQKGLSLRTPSYRGIAISFPAKIAELVPRKRRVSPLAKATEDVSPINMNGYSYARMCNNKTSRSAADYLYRLSYLVAQPIENLQTDNGSEFASEFERTSVGLGI